MELIWICPNGHIVREPGFATGCSWCKECDDFLPAKRLEKVETD